MQVLFVIREDARRNLGGDTIQMLKTKAALENLGLTVEVRGTIYRPATSPTSSTFRRPSPRGRPLRYCRNGGSPPSSPQSTGICWITGLSLR
jgi:hypothetical protein